MSISTLRALPLVAVALLTSSCAAMLQSWRDSHCSYGAAYAEGTTAARQHHDPDVGSYGQCTPETRDATMRGYNEGFAAETRKQDELRAAEQQQWLAANCNYDAAIVAGARAYEAGLALDMEPYGACAEPSRSDAMHGFRIGYERVAREAPRLPPLSGDLSPIVNEPSGKCIDASPRPDGATLQLGMCNAGGAQAWGVRRLPDGRVNLVHAASGRCIDSAGGSGPEDQRLRLWGCNGRPSQSFARVDVPGVSGLYTLADAAGGCIDVQDHSNEPGAPLRIAPCDGGYAQRWRTPGLAR